MIINVLNICYYDHQLSVSLLNDIKICLVDKVQLTLPILSLDDVQWGEDLVDTENSTIILPLGVNGTKQQYRLGINEVRIFNNDLSTILIYEVAIY